MRFVPHPIPESLHFEKLFARLKFPHIFRGFNRTVLSVKISLSMEVAGMTEERREIFLVLRSQTGDNSAFDELLKLVQQPLFRYIYRLTGEHALAEDILQEVFIIIYRKLRWLENPKLFRAWVYRIASRETFRRLKMERHWTEQIRDEEILERISSDE